MCVCVYIYIVCMCVYVCIYMYSVCPGSWHRAPKTLAISWVAGARGASFVTYNKSLISTRGKVYGNEVTLAEWGLGAKEATTELQPHAPASGEGGGVGDHQANHQWPMIYATGPMWWNHKTPKWSGSESFWVAECIHVPEGRCTPTPQRQKLLHLGPLCTLPYVPLHVAVHFYPLQCPL